MDDGSPFARSEVVRFLYHGCHHKCGTHWLKRILSQVAAQYRLEWRDARPESSPPARGILFDQQSHLDPAGWDHFRGSHMVRDPRDVVVSGYFYHLWTNEAWVHEPKPEFLGRTYQQHLRSLSQEDGLIAEIDKSRFVFRKMGEWNYGHAAICELKYEIVFVDPEGEFRRLFQHYGFHEQAVETALEIARRSDFESVAGRKPGVVKERSVTRSGLPGQWRETFSPRVKRHFQEMTGELLQQLGYEPDDRWAV